ncbi:hypothetical protein VTN31DRAFT_677 [Thermomyces dupontii]|uniref:uncharacterized protein n=1 Tax=Talaromyces thermophilus TaxID=28565 RepID=UPI0037434826
MSSSATVTVAQPAASSPASQQPVIRQDSTATGRSEERRHSSFSLVSSGTDDDAQFEPHPGIRLDLPRTRSVSSTTSSYRSRQRSPPVPPVRFTQLHLPAPENKYLGFCKGAWKLQQYGVPNMNKVFSLVTRPTGYFRDRPYWKCDKCAYSGRVYGVEGRRPSWTCDPSWHVHAMTGIGYRWAFLAKSHIARSRPAAADHQHDGDEEDSGRRGPFGCIFCCAMFRTDTPAFGTLDMFMVHLAQTHHKFPPGFDPLLEKMKCVVGRVVDSGGEEDCDVNIPPM